MTVIAWDGKTLCRRWRLPAGMTYIAAAAALISLALMTEVAS